MTKILIAAAATLLVGTPFVLQATPAEAQVLAGRNAARVSAPSLSREERLAGRLADAEERKLEIEDEIAAIQAEVDTSGGPTPAQERKLARLNQRRERETREIERLTAALDNN